MTPKVYIDGQEGTTGLQIYQRLGGRTDIELLIIDPALRKDATERKKLMDAADLVFLCLPDKAALDAVAMMEGTSTRIIDASTAHRTNPAWVYGFAELCPTQAGKIAAAPYVANPGCHATGFISIVAPLVQAGVLSPDSALSVLSHTGYSGGGKSMIADYEGDAKADPLESPCLYGLAQVHKHMHEMTVLCGLDVDPTFIPIVDDYYKGMATTVPFHMSQFQGVSTLAEVQAVLAKHYAGKAVVSVSAENPGKIYANAKAGKDSLELILAGNDQRFTITALFDNLGKGASGAAVQNMNLMLGFEETACLAL